MRKDVVSLFLINIGSGLKVSLIPPLFPQMAIEKGISETIIGLIISTFVISNSIVIQFSQDILSKYGRYKSFLFAFFLDVFCLLSFSFLQKINDEFLFVLIAIIIRILQGGASAVIILLVYSNSSNVEDETDIFEKLGFVDLGFYIGLIIGTLFGSYLYYLGGFQAPFIFVSVFNLFLVFSIKNIEFPEDLKIQKENGIFNYLKNPHILTIIILTALNSVTKSFFYPSLSNHLFTKFNLSVEESSNFFIIGIISYFMTLKIIKNLSKKYQYKVIILSGFIINFICVLLIPPIDLLYQSYYIVVLGLFFLGIGSAAIVIPGLCELINNLKKYYPENKNQINDLAIMIWMNGNIIGDSTGPLIGGILTDYTGFKSSCVVISLLNFFFCVFFFFIVFQFNVEELYQLRNKSNDLTERLRLVTYDQDFELHSDENKNNKKCIFEM